MSEIMTLISSNQIFDGVSWKKSIALQPKLHMIAGNKKSESERDRERERVRE